MAFELREGQGTLFRTKESRDEGGACDYTGSVKIQGREFQIFGDDIGEDVKELRLCEGRNKSAEMKLRPNPEKAQGDNRPNYKGVVHVLDGAYEIAAWARVGKNKGTRYLGLKATKKEQQPPAESQEKPKTVQGEIVDDDEENPF